MTLVVLDHDGRIVLSCPCYELILCDRDTYTACPGIVQMRMNLRMRMVVLNPMLMHVHAICFGASRVPRQPLGACAHRGRRQRAPGQVVVFDAE
jgi:hypothetical protein